MNLDTFFDDLMEMAFVSDDAPISSDLLAPIVDVEYEEVESLPIDYITEP